MTPQSSIDLIRAALKLGALQNYDNDNHAIFTAALTAFDELTADQPLVELQRQMASPHTATLTWTKERP